MTQSKLFNPNTFSIENSPFRDNIEAHSDIECIIFHNINGIKDIDNWTQINMTMKDMNATIIGLAETNTTFFGPHIQKWTSITRKTFNHSKTVTSESDIRTENAYKPGGTITT
jgi:hypothetical protein